MVFAKTLTSEKKELRDIPHLGGLPIIGHPQRLYNNPGQYLYEGYTRHGDIFRLNLFGMKMVCLIGPEANRMVMTTARECFSHAQGYKFVTPVLGEGLLFQDGDEHARNRNLMMPAFNANGVRAYFDVMHNISNQYIQRWATEGTASMYERFRQLTFDVMGRLIFGVDVNQDNKRLGALNEQLSRGVISFPRLNLPFLPYGKGLQARDEIRKYLADVIRQRRASPVTEDALGLLMTATDDSGESLTDEELVSQIIILMFAGHETTMSMLTSALALLKEHPEVLRRIRHERDDVVGDSELTPEHLKKMEYLDCALREVERVRPPIPLTMRGVVQELDYRGYRLPVGTTILISSAASHRLPRYFHDPEKFDPDRFMPPRSEHRVTPYSLIGFGGGQRLCIGRAFSLMEMKVVLCLLLKDFDWELDNSTPKLKYLPTAYPVCGLQGKIVPRL